MPPNLSRATRLASCCDMPLRRFSSTASSMCPNSSSSSSSSSLFTPKNAVQRLSKIRSQSIDGLLIGSRKKARHCRSYPFPALGLFFDLFLSQAAQRIVFGAAVVLGGSPFRFNPPPLLQPEKRRIDRPLIQA